MGLSLGGPNAYLVMIAEFLANLADNLPISALARYHLTHYVGIRVGKSLHIVSSCTIMSFNQTDTFNNLLTLKCTAQPVTQKRGVHW